MEPTGQLNGSDLQIDPDGTFEILVSSERKSRNWLPMRPDTTGLVVRQTFRNRKQETPAQLKIECLNPDADDKLQPEQFAAQLQNAVKFVRGTANLFVNWMEIYRGHLNRLPSDDQQRCQAAGGDRAIHYAELLEADAR